MQSAGDWPGSPPAAHRGPFAASFAPKAARLLGLRHDIGKFRPEFQEYLRKSAAAGHRDDSGPRYEHAIVGAYRTHEENRSDLALAIAAHHGRLHDLTTFAQNEVTRGSKIQCDIPIELLESSGVEPAPADAQALWIRFLFSALVDADSLETELWDKGIPRWRCATSIADLADQLETHIALELPKREPSPIDPLRNKVQQNCRERARNPMGAFRLTVPTGGGKTLSSLLFALHHAVHHDLLRVIVVIPYTSIIEQTAATYREIFGNDAVLEHHSNLDPENETLNNRHCVENWDSPIIVTTSVQFFETLHANDKRTLRKLHSIAESVVVFDEVQTFPLPLVKPIKDVLRRLNDHFRISTVHCSTTQPLLVQADAAEIVPDVKELFSITKSRVNVNWNIGEPAAWATLASAIRDHPKKQVLAVVHTKRDAMDLARAVGDECIHLSTLLCPLHRNAGGTTPTPPRGKDLRKLGPARPELGLRVCS
jgi:CRISPR-associated endonuclease/helicase Cas3